MNSDSSRLLKLTSGVITFFAIMIKIGMGLLTAIIVSLPFIWGRVAAELSAKSPGQDFAGALPPLFAIFLVGLAILYLMTRILATLRKIVGSVQQDDPFNPINAGRLRHIGMLILGMEAIGAIGGAMGMWLSHFLDDVDLGFGISLSGLLSALLCFVLAMVFEHGSELRAEVEGTV